MGPYPAATLAALGMLESMKRALIIGASGGIGTALVEALTDYEPTYELTLVGRDARTLGGLSGQAVPTDVTSELEVEALFADLPPQDLIVYAAGDIQPEPLATTSADTWTRIMDANLTGLFYVLKYADAKLNQDARIFVLGARPELVTFRGFGAYAAAKAGVAALVKVAAQEYKRKASLTLVLPKAINTGFWEAVGKPPKDALEPRAVAEAVVASLAAKPEEVLRIG